MSPICTFDVLDALSTLDCTKVMGADKGLLNTMPHHTLYLYSSLILLKFIKAYSFLWTGKYIHVLHLSTKVETHT